MRKINYLLISVISMFLLVACQKAENKRQVTSDFDFSFIECMGMNLSDMCDNMGIKEEQLEVLDHGVYLLKDTVGYEDAEFTGYFNFDTETETLCGGGYYCYINDSADEFSKLVSSLLEKMESIYGEPIKDPYKIDGIYGVEDFSHDTDMYLVENWNVPNSPDTPIRLQIWLLDEGDPNRIQIEYKVQGLPKSFSKINN